MMEGCGERKRHSLLVVLQSVTITMEISVENSQKFKSLYYMTLLWSSVAYPQWMDKLLQGHLLSRIHCSSSHHSWGMERTFVYNWRMNNECGAGILWSFSDVKKKVKSWLLPWMDGTRKDRVEWDNLDQKDN